MLVIFTKFLMLLFYNIFTIQKSNIKITLNTRALFKWYDCIKFLWEYVPKSWRIQFACLDNMPYIKYIHHMHNKCNL